VPRPRGGDGPYRYQLDDASIRNMANMLRTFYDTAVHAAADTHTAALAEWNGEHERLVATFRGHTHGPRPVYRGLDMQSLQDSLLGLVRDMTTGLQAHFTLPENDPVLHRQQCNVQPVEGVAGARARVRRQQAAREPVVPEGAGPLQAEPDANNA
jgi:hypothetical protein